MFFVAESVTGDREEFEQLPADPELPYEHEGVLLLTARAAGGTGLG